MREIIRLTTHTYNRRHKEVLWKSVFSPGSVIVFTRPEILLLSSTKPKYIQVFFKHLTSSFGIAKHLLPSYEVSVKLWTLERLFSLGLKSSRISPIIGLTTSMFASHAGNNCIMSMFWDGSNHFIMPSKKTKSGEIQLSCNHYICCMYKPN